LATVDVKLVLITIDCHHEECFEAFTNKVIFHCEERRIASFDIAPKDS